MASRRRQRLIKASQRQVVPLAPKGYRFDTNPQTQVPEEVKRAQGYAWADVQNGVIHAPHHLDRREKAHEIAHIFDYQVLDEADRARLARIIGAPQQNWYGGMRGPAEFFADYYAAAAMGDQPGKAKRVKGGGLRGGSDTNYVQVDAKRLRRFRKVLDQIAQRQNLGFGQLYSRPGGPITGSNPIEQDG